jgi:excisionase family DNA binding protein
VTPPSLLRLSQLARFWEVNARTLMTWIEQGRLAAIRSPGNHYRVRVADVRAFCEREGRPVPPFVAPAQRRVVTAVAALRNAKLPGVVVEAHGDPYGAIVASAHETTALLVLPASAAHFDTAAAIAALRRVRSASAMAIVVVGAPPARASALVAAGATRVLPRRGARPDDLPRVLRELLALE